MRASVSAQGRCSRKLLPKSLNCRATSQQNDGRAAAFLRFEEAVVAHRGEDRSDRRPCFEVGGAAARRSRDRGFPGTDDLDSVDRDFRAAQLADLPGSVAVNRGAAAASDDRAEAVERSDEAPAAAGKGGEF